MFKSIAALVVAALLLAACHASPRSALDVDQQAHRKTGVGHQGPSKGGKSSPSKGSLKGKGKGKASGKGSGKGKGGDSEGKGKGKGEASVIPFSGDEEEASGEETDKTEKGLIEEGSAGKGGKSGGKGGKSGGKGSSGKGDKARASKSGKGGKSRFGKSGKGIPTKTEKMKVKGLSKEADKLEKGAA